MSTPQPPRRAATKRSLIGAAVLAVLIAAVVVLTGQRSPEPHAAPPPASRTPAPTASPAPAADARPAPRIREVSALLRERATAIRDGDRAAFLAGIDPAAPESFRAAQLRMFDNLRGVPLSAWRYRLNPAEGADTSRLGPQPGKPDELWAPKVSLLYGLDGADSQPTERPMGYLFARHGDRWYLSSDTAFGSGKTWRGPWDFGPCKVIRTRSGLILYHPGGEASAKAVAAQLDADIDAVTAVWGKGWQRTVAVFVPHGHAELRSLVGQEFSADTIAAVAVADSVDTGRHVAKGQRVVLNPAGATQLSRQALAVTLRHEITHIAARAETVDGAPMWLLEGFADYVGYAPSGLPMAKAAPDLAAQVRAGKLPQRLPKDADFGAQSSRLDLAYQRGWTLCSYIADRYGQANLVRFYLAAVRYGHLDDDKLDAILRQRFGTDIDGLVAGWRGYLRSRLG